MVPFKLTDEFLEHVRQFIADVQNDELVRLFEDLHYADIAEIIN